MPIPDRRGHMNDDEKRARLSDIEETIAPIALKTIDDWVVAHTKR